MHIRVIQYNIGKFNMGLPGGISANVSEKISNYSNFFATVNPDFVFLQEYVDYIDSAQQYKAKETIFDPLFQYSSYTEKENIIFGKSSINNTAFSYLHTSGDNPAWCIYGTTTIKGKTVSIVSAVLNSSAPSGVDHQEQGIRALTKLTNQILANSDYVIIGMDINSLSQSEVDVFNNFMAEKGYKSANWGKYGYKNTYNLSSSMYKAIDTVFVKGNMKIINFDVPDVYADLSSDHFPIVVDIII